MYTLQSVCRSLKQGVALQGISHVLVISGRAGGSQALAPDVGWEGEGSRGQREGADTGPLGVSEGAGGAQHLHHQLYIPPQKP